MKRCIYIYFNFANDFSFNTLQIFCEMLSTTVNIEACDFNANVMGVGFSEDIENPVQFRADLVRFSSFFFFFLIFQIHFQDWTLFEVAMKIANLIEYRAGFLLFFYNEMYSKKPGDRFIEGRKLIVSSKLFVLIFINYFAHFFLVFFSISKNFNSKFNEAF